MQQPQSRPLSRWSLVLTVAIAIAIAVLGCCCPVLPLPMLTRAPLRQIKPPVAAPLASEGAVVIRPASATGP